MSFIVWLAVLGAVLLTLALTSSYLRWMPVTTSAVCLVLGIAIGPAGLDLLKLDIKDAANWMEHLTEVAVLFSLLSADSSCVCRSGIANGASHSGWRGR